MLLLAAAIAIFRFAKVDKATRALCCWIWLGVTTESLAWLWALRQGNNMPVYTISSFAELAIICSYFHFSQPDIGKKKIGYLVVPAVTILGVLNLIYLQPIDQNNSNFVFLECLVFSIMGLYSIYRLLLADDIRLTQQTHFWIVLIFQFYQCGSLWNWGFYNYMLRRHNDVLIVWQAIFITINVIVYAGFALVLFLYPKMRRNYA